MSQVEEVKTWEERLLDELERKAGKEKVVVLHVVKRSSTGYYNYKTVGLLIWYLPNPMVRYEDADVRDLAVDTVYCGVFEEYSCEALEEAAGRRGWYVVKFP